MAVSAAPPPPVYPSPKKIPKLSLLRTHSTRSTPRARPSAPKKRTITGRGQLLSIDHYLGALRTMRVHQNIGSLGGGGGGKVVGVRGSEEELNKLQDDADRREKQLKQQVSGAAGREGWMDGWTDGRTDGRREGGREL